MFNSSVTIVRQFCLCLVRLLIFLILGVTVAGYLNSRNFANYFSKTLIRLHAEPGLGVDSRELAALIASRDYSLLQQLLDKYYNVYALVITDCIAAGDACPGQRIIFSTNPRLYGRPAFRVEELRAYPYVLLREAVPSSVMDLLAPKARQKGVKEVVIGRVYSISTIPTFSEDYRMWLKDPFRDNDLWRNYRLTLAASGVAALLLWLSLEMFLKKRRSELREAAKREAELMHSADGYLRRLEENELRVREQERRFFEQYEAYVGRITELEQQLFSADQYRQISETIINELEAERDRQAQGFREQLEQTRQEQQSLQQELERFKAASGREKDQASRALEQAINPPVANLFEQTVVATIAGSAKGKSGEWLVITHFDAAGSRAVSKSIDVIVISKVCLMVLEVKNYSGAIEAEGDTVNSRWSCRSEGRDAIAVKSSWGINPYHQLREYTMGIMQLLQRSRTNWNLPVYGVIVFPDTADIAAMEARIGKYYRITTSGRLVGMLENVEAEARRENPYAKRPAPSQVEKLLRGQ